MQQKGSTAVNRFSQAGKGTWKIQWKESFEENKIIIKALHFWKTKLQRTISLE